MGHLATFIGFGEASYSIAKGLKSEGATDIRAFDIMQDQEPQCQLIRKRAEEVGVQLMGSVEEAVEGAEIVFSINSPKVCVSVAKGIVPFLKAGQTLIDCNAAAPTSMQEIAELPFAEGALFCDAGMMGSVPASGHKIKMFLSGNGAQHFHDVMEPYHFVNTVLDAPAGGASAIKMFKSVWSKGIPQLIIESLMPAAKYGVYEQAIQGIKNPFKGNVEEECQLLVYRTMIHAGRRISEMEFVAETIEKLGLDASMSRAAAKRLSDISRVDYKLRLEEGRESLAELIAILNEDWK